MTQKELWLWQEALKVAWDWAYAKDERGGRYFFYNWGLDLMGFMESTPY